MLISLFNATSVLLFRIRFFVSIPNCSTTYTHTIPKHMGHLQIKITTPYVDLSLRYIVFPMRGKLIIWIKKQSYKVFKLLASRISVMSLVFDK